ncbi:hypothetical protein F4813DRAFT_300727 [Daldinia decipiens]|uniref:uncharacterized protein n=1 Tax=Daldinia decipiens TaxID=326647 RepID=UPI0020C321C6|nr:uncharacterized protein F4813DRAFT_300727 [Daldinia decipiens]KAI1652728.1 hypothetical protein F4813DRAFT_300727 [Daldinia decipiens]
MECFLENISSFQLACPTLLSLAYCPLRMTIGEWMLYSQVLGRFMKRYEYSFRNNELQLDQDEMMDLHKWRHRIMQSRFKLELTRNFVSYHSGVETKREAWTFVLTDLDHLSRKIEQYGLCLEQMIPVAASMTQLLDSRRSLMESVGVKRLTYVALVFVPLSSVAAIFSMPGDFAPGQSQFWVYFAVAVPLCICIFACILVIESLRSWEALLDRKKEWNRLKFS